MTPVSIATVIAIGAITVAGMIAATAGYVVSRLLRKRWSIRNGAVDWVLGAGLSVGSAFVIGAMAHSPSDLFESRVTHIALIAVSGVVIKHVIDKVRFRQRGKTPS